MIQVFDLRNKMEYFDEAVQMYWDQWGSDSNYKFYHDCMVHSCRSDSDLPRFYIAVHNDSIVGTYALLRNDLISRQDLYPWFACLYVIPELRSNKVGSMLLTHALEETRQLGLKKLYLSTDLEGYYEKYDWTFLTNGYTFNGDATKIYEAPVPSN